MNYSPIAYTSIHYEDHITWWIKAYEQGTTTPLVMSVDKVGTTLVAKYQIGTSGFPISDGGAIVIPHIFGDYDLWLFPTATEADNNDTSSAVQLADNINASEIPDQTNHAGELLTTDGTDLSWAGFSGLLGEINLDEYVTNDAAASAEINAAAVIAVSTGKALVSYDTSRTFVLTASEPINLFKLKYISINAIIDTTAVDTTESAILLGDLAQSQGGEWKFSDFISSNLYYNNVSHKANGGTGLGVDSPTLFPQVQISGAKDIKMEFGKVRYASFYTTYQLTDGTIGDGWRPDGTGLLYSQYGNTNCDIYFRRLIRFEVDGTQNKGKDTLLPADLYRKGTWANDPNLDTDGTMPLYFTSNTIRGGSLYQVHFVDKGYSHNQNIFMDNLFEGLNARIDIEIGHSNWFLGQRFEGLFIGVGADYEDSDGIPYNTGVFWGANAKFNNIEIGYTGTLTARETAIDWNLGGGLLMPVTNNGVCNKVYTTWNATGSRKNVVALTPDTTVLGCGTTNVIDLATSDTKGVFDNDIIPSVYNQNAAIPGLSSIVLPNNWTKMLQTKMIPVDAGSVFQVAVKITMGEYRFRVDTFDLNKVPLGKETWESGFDTTVPFFDFEKGGLSIVGASAYDYSADPTGYISPVTTTSYGTDKGSPVSIAVVDPDIKFISITVAGGDHVANGDVATVVEFAAISYFEDSVGGLHTATMATEKNKPLWLPKAPTTGRAPLGTTVETPTSKYRCTFELATKATSEAANAATSVVVDDITNIYPSGDIAVDDKIGMLLDDNTTHWSVVTSISTNTITFTDAITSPIATVGAKVLAGAPIVFIRWGEISIAPITQGTGSPETLVTGIVGDIYLRTDGSTSTTLYIKETGTGNTGWVAK